MSVLDLAIVAVRFIQYAGAAILFGSSLLCIYAVPGPLPTLLTGPARSLLAIAAAILALASLLAIALQASLFTGSFAGGFSLDAAGTVVSFMGFGKAAIVRAVAAGAALMLLVAAPPSRPALIAAGVCGAVATASLAWMGHAAASESWWRVASDLLHVWAAALWIGALAGFVLMLRQARAQAHSPAAAAWLHVALSRFSRIGVPLVLALTLSGVANVWFLAGAETGGEGILRLSVTPYGKLLVLKIAAFAAMLILAAINRNVLTPRLATQEGPAAIAGLRRTIAIETALGLGVLGLVGWLGTLEPLP